MEGLVSTLLLILLSGSNLIKNYLPYALLSQLQAWNSERMISITAYLKSLFMEIYLAKDPSSSVLTL